jgi:hypothetical protein
MRFVRRVARIGENSNSYRLLVISWSEGDHKEDKDVDGLLILRLILERKFEEL